MAFSKGRNKAPLGSATYFWLAKRGEGRFSEQCAFYFRKVSIASDAIDCAFIPPSLRPSWPSSVGIGFGLYDRVNDGLGYPLLDVALVRPTVTNALRQSDSYVWFYTEKIDFLKQASAGGVPDAWVEAIRKGKEDGLAGWKAPWP